VPDASKISVVIPSWNGRECLPMILSSLEGQTSSDFDVTVVDNASSDGSVGYVHDEWPRVRVVALAENVGYASAANQGIAATQGAYVALFNDDMEIEASWLERMADELDADPGLGVVTSKILFHGDRNTIYQAGFEYYTYGWCATRGAGETDEGQYDQRLPTIGGTGAASVWRREAIERSGGFDADYFMYCEEVDLGLRILLAGYRGLCVPEPVGYHVVGVKTANTPAVPRRLFYRNQLHTQFKNLPAPLLLRSLPKSVLFLQQQYRSERNGGTPRVARDAYLEFLKRLPRTLRQRRQVMKQRRISNGELRARLRADFPFPTESRLGRLIAGRGRD
jgi:GT2 family glycosyltransferase